MIQVDLTHIYGDTLEKQHKLRLFKDGKLKFQVLNYPVLHRRIFIEIIYFHSLIAIKHWCVMKQI